MKKSLDELHRWELVRFVDPVTGLLSREYSSLISCPLCGCAAVNHRQLFLKRGYWFVVCADCGLVMANPSINQDIIRTVYDTSAYWEKWGELLEHDYDPSNDLAIYSTLRKMIDVKPSGNVSVCLDVSVRGGVANECKDFKDMSIDFFDFSAFSRRVGKSRYPSSRWFSSFAGIEAEGKRYDAVISFEAIEQFSNPAEFVKNVYGILNYGGVFCGVLSNIESLRVRLEGGEAPMFDGLFQKFYFHSGSLSRLLGIAGFNAVSFKSMAPCEKLVRDILNRFIPDGIETGSRGEVESIVKLAGNGLLGYKIIFAAKK